MKTAFLSALTFAFVFSVQAQDCKSNLYMTANAKLQMTIYDKKGKESGMQTIQISDVKAAGGALESTVNTTMADEKGKTISTGSGTYHCNDGVLSADMKMFLPQEGMGNMNVTEAKMEPVYLEYPAALSIGQKLKDAEMKMDMKMNGMNASVDFKEEGRTVSGKETVTSPAGTWEAYVISYDGAMKTKMAGIGLPASNFTVKEWFVPGIGVVKSETASKNGKVIGTTLLTSIKK